MTYRKLLSCAAMPLTLALASPAFAQEEGPSDTASVTAPDDRDDEEDDEGKENEKEPKLETSFMLISEAHSMNNLDFRKLDESSDQAILESDDRNTFAYTGLTGELEYEVLETTAFNFAGGHTGMWGNDQIGSLAPPDRDKYGSHFLWVYRLNAEWEPIDNDNLELSTTIGRQDFEIGGVEDDFFLDDTVDAVTVELGLGRAGTFRALALDFYGVNSAPEDVDFVRYTSRLGVTQPFRGNTNTRRHGLVYENTQLLDGLEFRAFGFYADIGAATYEDSLHGKSTGADRSYNGSLGNVADNDYLWLAGSRVNYTVETETFEVGAFGEFARSGGIDRKDIEIGLRDVTNDGNAYGAGLHGSVDLETLGLNADLRWFHADGGVYGSGNGIQSSHGFVSFKGDEVGGLNLDRYAGFHPSAYLGVGGVQDRPHTTSRHAGTEFLKAGLGFNLADRFSAEVDAWYLMDTSLTYLEQENLSEAAAEQPFGYTQADLEAQQRFGKPLGTEIDASLLFRANEALNFYAKGGVFLPSDFYAIEVERTVAGNSTALGSPNPQTFWAATAGTSLKF